MICFFSVSGMFRYNFYMIRVSISTYGKFFLLLMFFFISFMGFKIQTIEKQPLKVGTTTRTYFVLVLVLKAQMQKAGVVVTLLCRLHALSGKQRNCRAREIPDGVFAGPGMSVRSVHSAYYPLFADLGYANQFCTVGGKSNSLKFHPHSRAVDIFHAIVRKTE